MATFFRICDSANTKKLVLVFNLVVIMMSISHWVYAWLASTLNNAYKNDEIYGQSAVNSAYRSAEFTPLIAYYTITGIIQFVASFVVIVYTCKAIDGSSRPTATKTIFAFLLLSFLFNFALAVLAGIDATYYYQKWDMFFNSDAYVNTASNSYVILAIKFTKYTVAESILTFAVTLPLTACMIYGLTNSLFDDASVERIHSKEQV